MKKHLLLFLILLLTLPSLKAQGDFAPIGATWYFRTFLMSSPTNWGYRKYTSETELVHNGHLCRRILAYMPLNVYGNPIPWSHYFYIYTDSNRVYYATENSWAILYDFNKNAGESWINSATGDVVYVDSTTTTQISGKTLKKMLIHNSNYMWIVFSGWITEEIGWEYSLFPCLGDSAPPGFGYLRCYEDDSISLILESPCDEIIMERNDLPASIGFQLFPNPTRDYLQVVQEEFRKTEIELWGINGMVLVRKTLVGSEKLDLSGFNPGVYFVKTVSDQTARVEKVIKY